VFLPLVSGGFVPQHQAVAPAFLFRQPNTTRSHHRRSLTTTTTTTTVMSSAKRDSPSAQRNKEPIWQILESKVFSDANNNNNNNNNINDNDNDKKKKYQVLEVAAGAGVHTDYFATALASKTNEFVWYPTDPTDDSRASIDCYIQDSNYYSQIMVKPALPLTLDENGIQEAETASALKEDQKSFDLIVCINMIHISPWEATLGLMKVAGERLSTDGVLYCYGPYKVGGMAAESNL
jgi:hypothetical protein